jgi:hypothetical protein
MTPFQVDMRGGLGHPVHLPKQVWQMLRELHLHSTAPIR